MSTIFGVLYLQAQLFAARLRREDGLEAVEYALIAALIAVAIIAAVQGLQGQISATFKTIQNALAGAN
jgi:pilus assembly protein Flp/PilA